MEGTMIATKFTLLYHDGPGDHYVYAHSAELGVMDAVQLVRLRCERFNSPPPLRIKLEPVLNATDDYIDTLPVLDSADDITDQVMDA
jgi:hypothetical protein